MGGGALNCGADVAITSAHKTLGSMCGTALINIGKNSKLDVERVKSAYYIFETTTPSPVGLLNVENVVYSEN